MNRPLSQRTAFLLDILVGVVRRDDSGLRMVQAALSGVRADAERPVRTVRRRSCSVNAPTLCSAKVLRCRAMLRVSSRGSTAPSPVSARNTQGLRPARRLRLQSSDRVSTGQPLRPRQPHGRPIAQASAFTKLDGEGNPSRAGLYMMQSISKSLGKCPALLGTSAPNSKPSEA